ncbi:MAG: DEAD/DEAH box helicase, partial [Myxococcota bacterium]|nr:DEAD/DEAH box helicase [Myxococcota bacterium]
RVDGGLFFLIDAPGLLLTPDRLRVPGLDRRPGETAFVLTRLPDSGIWRYAGIGRWAEVEAAWGFPGVDFATWRALGSGRSASRTLPAVWQAQAEALVQQTLAGSGEGGWLEARGKRCRLVGVAAQGGLRLDGGPDGFAELTVSLTDLGWVLAAADDVARSGGVLDEARVNRLRYLEGTPKGSTRWIECGWAVVLVGRGEQTSAYC